LPIGAIGAIANIVSLLKGLAIKTLANFA